jgi:hypothetical protein
MPYNIRKKKCKQSDGDRGNWVLSYTDKKGKKHSNCHTSKKKAQGQIAAIEGPREGEELDYESEQVLKEYIKEIISKQKKDILAEAKIDDLAQDQSNAKDMKTGFNLLDSGIGQIATINFDSKKILSKLEGTTKEEKANSLVKSIIEKNPSLSPEEVLISTYVLGPEIWDSDNIDMQKAFGKGYNSERPSRGNFIELAWTAAARYAGRNASRVAGSGKGEDIDIDGISYESKLGTSGWNFQFQTTVPKSNTRYILQKLSKNTLSFTVISGTVLRKKIGAPEELDDEKIKSIAKKVNDAIARGEFKSLGQLIANQLSGKSGTQTIKLQLVDGENPYKVSIKSFVQG